MKKTRSKQTQQAILRKARDTLGVTTEELAGQLGKSLKAVRAWLEPETSPSHRKMPEGSRMLLKRILDDHKAAKGKP